MQEEEPTEELTDTEVLAGCDCQPRTLQEVMEHTLSKLSQVRLECLYANEGIEQQFEAILKALCSAKILEHTAGDSVKYYVQCKLYSTVCCSF